MADIAASRAGDVASARYALARARAEAGTPAAAAWLDRALRLAPGAPTVAFVAATDLAASDPVRALAMLRALWAAHPRFREAGLALVAAEMQAGRADAACACLRAVLGAHAPPADVRFAALADSVCRAAGEAGWLAVDSGGAMRFSATRPVRLELDGARIRPYGKRAVAAEELPAGWETAALLTAKCGGTHLLGSPVRLGARRRAEGFVAAAAEGGLCGWAWLPEDADRPVRLSLVLDGVARSIVAADETVAASPAHLLDRRRRIAVPAAEVVGIDEIRVIGPDGRELAGSPVRPAWERGAARHAAARHGARCGARRARCDDAGADDPWRPLDMALLPPPDSAFETHAHRASRGVDVVIPVWRGAAEFGACLAALHNELPPRCRIVVVNDASPDIALCALLARHEAERRIVLVRHPTNRGFPAAANSGLRRAVQAGHDALLLNPDTLPPAGAIQRLAEIAYGAADIGSVTPMSNDGSLVSYAGAMGIAGGDDVARLDAAFRLANGRACIEIPTGVGFCMYVRHDCLLRTGFFREDMFAQGYGEENDWCLRARHLGWRHVAATGVFVAHLGGRSFGAVKADLMARNISLLNRLYPGYDAAMRAFAAQDPLAPSRRAVDAERWSRGRCAGGAVVMVAHGRQGGVGPRHRRAGGNAARAGHPADHPVAARYVSAQRDDRRRR